MTYIAMLGYPELLVVLVILLLLFGGSRLPQLASGLGKSIKAFKRGVNEGEDEAETEATRTRELRPAAETTRYKEEDLAADRFTANKPR